MRKSNFVADFVVEFHEEIVARVLRVDKKPLLDVVRVAGQDRTAFRAARNRYVVAVVNGIAAEYFVLPVDAAARKRLS